MRFARENPIQRLKVSLMLHDGLQGLDTLCSPELLLVLAYLTLDLVYPGTRGGQGVEQNALNASARTVARLPWSNFLVRLAPSST